MAGRVWLVVPQVPLMRMLPTALLGLAGFSLAALGPFCQPASSGTVLSIGDGDTISVFERGQ
jgi:hypothetical protein